MGVGMVAWHESKMRAVAGASVPRVCAPREVEE
jgi:hypothetical protein